MRGRTPGGCGVAARIGTAEVAAGPPLAGDLVSSRHRRPRRSGAGCDDIGGEGSIKSPNRGEPAGQRAAGPMRRHARWLAVAAAVVLGVLGGLGSFTFGYGDGLAYLRNDPAKCANCHVMQSSYDTWLKSSHRGVATCNDCHLAHHPVAKWLTKADNGFFHSLAFTTDRFHEPIRIKSRNRRVSQDACLHCHRQFVDELLPATRGSDTPWCVQCHADVGHALRD